MPLKMLAFTHTRIPFMSSNIIIHFNIFRANLFDFSNKLSRILLVQY